MAKLLREGASYSQREVIDLLSEFSAFKDRVTRKFKDWLKNWKAKQMSMSYG